MPLPGSHCVDKWGGRWPAGVAVRIILYFNDFVVAGLFLRCLKLKRNHNRDPNRIALDQYALYFGLDQNTWISSDVCFNYFSPGWKFPVARRHWSMSFNFNELLLQRVRNSELRECLWSELSKVKNSGTEQIRWLLCTRVPPELHSDWGNFSRGGGGGIVTLPVLASDSKMD